MPRDNHVRKLTGRHRFCDVSHLKLMDLFKSLRRRRLKNNAARRSSLTHSLSFPLPAADHDSFPVQPPLPNVFASSSVRYRPGVVGILSVTEEGSSSMHPSSSELEGAAYVEGRNHDLSPHLVPRFPTCPSMFQLRSASTKDYLVDRLERDLRQLSLADDTSTVCQNTSAGDIPMCMDVPIDPGPSPRRAPSDSHARKPMSPPHDQNVVPMMLITSADAKLAKPLPPSSHRSSRTPFGPANFADPLTNTNSAPSKLKTPPEDIFRPQLHDHGYPPDYSLTFRLPPFPAAYPSPSEYYSPETPTPMCCDHFGDCRGDLWEVLHPPLVAGRFTLPPFKLPSMSTGVFDDMPLSLPY